MEIPQSAGQATASLARLRDAEIIAGGTLVMPRLRDGNHGIGTLVSLSGLGLNRITVKGEAVTIGATTTLAAIGAHPGLIFLTTAIESVGSPTLRNLATIGGNLFTEQPYGDIAVCLLALDATVTVVAGRAKKKIPVEILLKDGIRRGAMVTEIQFRRPEKGTWFYRKAMRRTLNSASIVTIAAQLPRKKSKITVARIALGGCGRRAMRSRAAEAVLNGAKFDAETVAEAAQATLKDAKPFTDAYASAWYRKAVLPVHFRRALLGE